MSVFEVFSLGNSVSPETNPLISFLDEVGKGRNNLFAQIEETT